MKLDTLIQLAIAIFLLIQAMPVIVGFARWSSEKGVLKVIFSLVLALAAPLFYCLGVAGLFWLKWSNLAVATCFMAHITAFATNFMIRTGEIRRFDIVLLVLQACVAFQLIAFALSRNPHPA